MKDRIRQLMEAQHMNQQAFAQYTGIGSASLSSIFTGRTNPTLKHVDLIIEKFPNVNPMWLLKGQGGMFLLNDENKTENSDINSAVSASQPNGENSSGNQSGSMQGDLFSSANMAVQPSFFDNATSSPSQTVSPQNSQISHSRHYQQQNAVHSIPQQNAVLSIPQQSIVTPTPQRKITEIRIFYDDQTWESFVPKK